MNFKSPLFSIINFTKSKFYIIFSNSLKQKESITFYRNKSTVKYNLSVLHLVNFKATINTLRRIDSQSNLYIINATDILLYIYSRYSFYKISSISFLLHQTNESY